MVIDCAKGVEERTIKLMDVCRLRDTPIMTFINKLDREGRDADRAARRDRARARRSQCAPVTWPIGMGRDLQGRLPPARGPHLRLSAAGERGRVGDEPSRSTGSTADARRRTARRPRRRRCATRSSWCRGAATTFDLDAYLAGRADAGVLRLGDQQLRRRGTARRLRRVRAGAAAARDARSAPVDAGRAEAHRLRVQDPGEHGSRATATASPSCASAPGSYTQAA